MRVLVVGEGKNDLGYVVPGGWCNGAVTMFVERLLTESEAHTVTTITWREIRIRGSGFDRKIGAAMQIARDRGFDAVVAVTDRDSRPKERRLESMAEGRNQAREILGIDGAVGLAIEKIEAWLLADETAIRKATNDDSIQPQPDPESLGSRDRASMNNPKHRLRQLIGNPEETGRTLTKVYAAIAESADLTVVAQRCPQGFAPFAEDVRRLRDGYDSTGNP